MNNPKFKLNEMFSSNLPKDESIQNLIQKYLKN